MEDLWALLRVGHLLAAVFMAAPLYALLAVNERGRFGTAITHNLDDYLEGMIRRQPLRCYAYLAMLLLTGLLLLSLFLGGLGVLLESRTLMDGSDLPLHLNGSQRTAHPSFSPSSAS